MTTAVVTKDDILAAVDRNEFVLYFQPHVRLVNGKIDGAESLIRWQHPEHGLLGPADFIPFAEEHGITEIGAWVLAETARVSRAWRMEDPDFHIWFNLSGTEFKDPSLLTRLQAFDDDDRWGIGVEVSETVAMANVEETRSIMDALHRLGLFIALDDFGTGYTSLQHLKRLPIDVLKIDNAFVSHLPSSKQDAAIVDALLSIARAFSFATMAEGIETEDQAAALRAAGCELGQGYFFARPLPAEAFAQMLMRA